MYQNADATLARIHLPADSAAIKATAGRDSEIARLEAERIACARSLEKLNAHMLVLEAERAQANDPPEARLLERLHLLANMSPALRTSLHALLGYASLLRMDGELTDLQIERVDAMQVAGTRLLEQVFSALTLADLTAETTPLHIDDAGPRLGGAGAIDTSVTSLRILIADDNLMNRDIAAVFLKAAGHAVCCVDSGSDAVRAASTMDFDVILLDICMPEIDGIEAARFIRALPGARGRTPIVALTALASPEEIDLCRKTGMNGHLAKPFRQDTLNVAVLNAATAGGSELRAVPAGANGDDARLPQSYARILAETRECHYETADKTSSPDWIEIASPWHGAAPNASAPAIRADVKGAPGRQFDLKLTDVGSQRGRRRLVGGTLSCAPARDWDQHEFHWLVFVNDAPADAPAFRATCDLWRWSRGAWQSITAPGASFGPEDMFEQGWRYCAPCADVVARIEVS